MSSPSSLLLPENGDDWPIRILVLVTPCALATPPANKHSAPTAAVNARIVVIAPPLSLKSAAEISALLSPREDAPYRRFYTATKGAEALAFAIERRIL